MGRAERRASMQQMQQIPRTRPMRSSMGGGGSEWNGLALADGTLQNREWPHLQKKGPYAFCRHCESVRFVDLPMPRTESRAFIALHKNCITGNLVESQSRILGKAYDLWVYGQGQIMKKALGAHETKHKRPQSDIGVLVSHSGSPQLGSKARSRGEWYVVLMSRMELIEAMRKQRDYEAMVKRLIDGTFPGVTPMCFFFDGICGLYGLDKTAMDAAIDLAKIADVGSGERTI